MKADQLPLDDNTACEWNPTEEREARPGENHDYATVLLGKKWRLCDACSKLPQFARFRNRATIRWERQKAA